MNFLFLLSLSFRSLFRNKLRSGLTMLGVIIGVGSVVAMVAIGEGAKSSLQKSLSNSMGLDYFYVRPGAHSSKGASMGSGTINTLTIDDGIAMVEECSLVSAYSPVFYSNAQVIYEDKNWSPETMAGVGANYSSIKKLRISEGDWFTEQDERRGAKVCVIGMTIKNELFPFSSPIGKMIRIGNVPMLVIGLLQVRGTSLWGSDQDSSVFLPWTTMFQRLSKKKKKRNTVERLIMSTPSIEHMDEAIQQVTKLLRYRHKIKKGDANDFRAYDLSKYIESYGEQAKTMSKLIAIIASISLLIGGIGIMNIMLVSVTERTREIGLRMAVGAKSNHILFQFLMESATLSSMGGLIGIGLGEVARYFIIHVVGWPAEMSVDAMLLAFGVSLLIGVAFGFYPSWKASRLDPIECLKYE